MQSYRRWITYQSLRFGRKMIFPFIYTRVDPQLSFPLIVEISFYFYWRLKDNQYIMNSNDHGKRDSKINQNFFILPTIILHL